MNKGELINALASTTNANKAESARFLDALIDVVSTTLARGEEIRLVGFGTFKVVKFTARKVRNPQNGKEMSLPAGCRPRFVPGKQLRCSVNSTKCHSK